MDILRRKRVLTLLGIITILLLFGCGEDTTKSATENNNKGDKTQDNNNDDLFPRTIKHSSGELTLEEKPERVALGDVNIIDYYLLIDDELPVGARIKTIDRSPALKDLVTKYDPEGEITSIGGKVNMETLIGLEPDLILLSEGKQDKYDRFAKVADTIVLDGSNDRTVRLKQLGDIFGKEEKVEEILQDMENLKEETKNKIEPNKEETVLFLRANGKDFTVLTPEEHGLLYEEMGLETAGNFDGTGEVTVESISDANPDHIFIMEARRQMDEDNIGALIDVWKDNSVWKNLYAVKNDQMYILDSLIADDFFTGWELELEALQEHLGE